jgi:hypothetical protein
LGEVAEEVEDDGAGEVVIDVLLGEEFAEVGSEFAAFGGEWRG